MRDFLTEMMLMMWMFFGYPIPPDHDTSHCEWSVAGTTKSGFEIGGWVCTWPIKRDESDKGDDNE